MTTLITCPSCQSSLRVPEADTAKSYTCPRCLGEITADASSTLTTERTPQPVTGDRPSAPPELSACRWCGAPVEVGTWRYCPDCGAPVKGRPPGRTAQSAMDAEVNQDRTRTGVVTYLLMGLGAFALLLLGIGSLNEGSGAPAVFIFLLAIITGIVWGVVYFRTRRRPQDLTVARVASSVAWVVGMFIFGYISLVVTVGIFFLVVCGLR